MEEEVKESSEDKNSNSYSEDIRHSSEADVNKSENSQQSKENMIKINKKAKKKVSKKDIFKVSKNVDIIEEQQSDVDDEENKKTCRLKFEQFITENDRQFKFQVLIATFTSVTYIFYIVCTYKHRLFKYFNYVDLFLVILYLLDYSIEFLVAHHKLAYVFSFWSLLNLFISIPTFFCFLTDDYMHSYLYIFINCSRVIRFSKICVILLNLKKIENNVTMKLITIISILFQIFIISAGLAQIVEYSEVERRIKCTTDFITKRSLQMRIKFHDYLYLLVVTTLTVGYGDIIPLTPLAKSMFIIIILLVIGIIPYQINDLINIMGAQNEYQLMSYKASVDIPHIILVGDISIDSLKSFCLELFHPDHGSGYKHAVIINNSPPSKELEIFLHEKSNESFIYYLQGDPMDENDLKRGDAPRAKACIIFNNKNSKDPYSSDHQSLFLGVFIKKYVVNYNLNKIKEAKTEDEKLSMINQQFHICIQLNKPESSSYYYSTLQSMYKKKMKSDQLIIIESFKMNLLSKSCLTPGIMALITNLVMSSGERKPVKITNEWLREYTEGRGHEIYRIPLQSYFKSKTFLEIVEFVYNHVQAIVFALEVEYGTASILKLNPSSNYKISDIVNKITDITMQKPIKKSNALETISNYINNTVNNKPEKNVRVFAYLICSDKSVADIISQKEREMSGQEDIAKNYEIPHTTDNNHFSTTNQKEHSLIQIVHEINNEIAANAEEASSSDSDDEISDNEEIMQFGSSDLIFYKKDYHFNNINEQQMRNNMEIMHHSIKDRDDITNHIVICGLHPALVHFVLPLRAKYLKEDALKWVVILAPNLPNYLFEAFTKFNRIIFIQGSPLLPENLLRANILNADKAVILSSGESKVTKSNTRKNSNEQIFNSEEQMLDAETIFIYKAIKKCNKNIQIMTELICTNNIEYLLNTSNLQKLLDDKDERPKYEFTPLYASGEVFTPSIIDCITCQSFYNPHIVTILQLILGGDNMQMTKKSRLLDEKLNLPGSNLYLVKIPDAYQNESFDEFFYYLITAYHSIGIALYRKNMIEGYYYVYTNPKKTTLLRDCDYVFVLSNSTDIQDLTEERVEGQLDNDITESELDEDKANDKSDLKDRSIVNDTNIHSDKKPRKNSLTKASEYDLFGENERTRMERNGFDHNMRTLNPKHNEIDKLKNKLEKIRNKLEELQTNFQALEGYVDKVINDEIISELKVYLSKG